MANNRMWLRCPCGAQFHLAKSLGVGWYVPPFHQGDMEAHLTGWFCEHMVCEGQPTLEFEQPGSDMMGLYT